MGTEQVVVESGGAGGGSGGTFLAHAASIERPIALKNHQKRKSFFPFWKHTSWK
ncbi:hypothetical protein [Achromobacter xylosoxidans]|uniref:hypothetical protein n=1 Tax=Alcaligenes xylosoxydans xylosoxydans TaxID=85698 RepID=UPI00138DF89D|nr:hypothetical protein [Achromobacter xylosoxidans]MCH1988465.1 hypothetical protein [Achromobacter xylosoxidans]MCH4587933.1 hypothetical protein [Achromobacter xylosoxidans]MCH4594072.1 hypothetical protein [Achromobacter xylosoxidans]QKI73893.1 hypothetical protein HPS43_15095 [Achromobacter xylosoxidans]WOB77176.1 hypothetical protein PZA07_05340 [Achromobacter xylosoxidans]